MKCQKMSMQLKLDWQFFGKESIKKIQAVKIQSTQHGFQRQEKQGQMRGTEVHLKWKERHTQHGAQGSQENECETWKLCQTAKGQTGFKPDWLSTAMEDRIAGGASCKWQALIRPSHRCVYSTDTIMSAILLPNISVMQYSSLGSTVCLTQSYRFQ